MQFRYVRIATFFRIVTLDVETLFIFTFLLYLYAYIFYINFQIAVCVYTSEYKKMYCAAKAFYSCPAIISRRPGSQDTPKESQLNSEEDSRIKQARSHVTLEKSS
jgi:hypothetical protein